ncbi:hypothetical protein [Gracilibacillus phocaeensis]|uniref:hypothetical protein n=1 Tax=Gracilibacillus phocaeensis TaxID=2042304 RepID=UPI0010325FC1|nr:hypothetical protein [Gracilibacillus phocaeensis]
MQRQKIKLDPKKVDIQERAKLIIYDEKYKKVFLEKEIEQGDTYSIDESTLDEHLKYIYKYQIIENDNWVDKTSFKALRFEKITDKGIKYILYPEQQSDFLIVGFQGISKTPSYNYVRSLKSARAVQLYIKDDYGTDDTNSSYYLGPEETTIIADATYELIEYIRNKFGIARENVICIGSSKGGFAALYFSYRGQYGHAIVGGPQIKLGTYLSHGKNADNLDENSFMPKILEYLVGKVTDKKIKRLDNILLDLIEQSNCDPNVFIHVGEGEPHYKKHVLPFLDKVKSLQLKNITTDLGTYDTHNELAKFFPNILQKAVLNITNTPQKNLILKDYENITADFNALKTITFEKNKKIALNVVKDNITYEFLLHIRENSKKAVVFGSGAYNPEKVAPPIFNRLSWCDYFDETCIYYNDPTLYLSEELTIGWGYGTNKKHYIEEIADILEILYKRINVHPKHVLYFGSSAGGFQSLMLGSKLKGLVVVNNPQTIIGNYYVSSVRNLLNCLRGDSLDPERSVVTNYFEKNNYVPAIMYIQNMASEHDMVAHFTPFIDELSKIKPNYIGNRRLRTLMYMNHEKGQSLLNTRETVKVIKNNLKLLK